MLMPARVVATLTDEQTRCVVASASGIESSSARSPAVIPFRPAPRSRPCSRCPARAPARSSACGRRHHARRAAPFGDERQRRHREPLVGDRHGEVGLAPPPSSEPAVRADAHQLVVDARAGPLQSFGGGVAQRDAHGHRADVEALALDHPQHFTDVGSVEANGARRHPPTISRDGNPATARAPRVPNFGATASERRRVATGPGRRRRSCRPRHRHRCRRIPGATPSRGCAGSAAPSARWDRRRQRRARRRQAS